MDATDVVVIGAGPAGTTAARLLARWGHAAIVLSAAPARRGFAESIPPSCRRLFDALDVLAPVDAAGFYRSTGNTVWWDLDQARVESFAGGERGYQVYRPDFDDLLAREAEAAGAAIRRGTIVRQVDLAGADTAIVRYTDGTGDPRLIATRFVLDCSGRAGVLARQGFRRSEVGHATLALVGAWKCPAGGWALPDPTHTLIEAYRNGWAWSVPVSPGERYVTVMVDRRERDLKRGGGLARAYRTELAKTRHLGPLLRRGLAAGIPWSADASLYSANSYAGPKFLLVGDAGSFIDPLSSFGVKKAMASSWLAAVATNTCLVNPSMQAAALEFYSERERTMYASYLEQSTKFFSDGAARYPDAFWAERADVHQTSGVATGDERALRDPRVAAAWEALRRSPDIALDPSPVLDIVRVPAVKGREVVYEPAVSGPGIEAPMRFVRGVDLVSVIELIDDGPGVPELFERYGRTRGTIPLPDFLAALSVLVGTGLIRNRRSGTIAPA